MDVHDTPYLRAFRGSFRGALRWGQLDELWEGVRRSAGAGWYVYVVGEDPPTMPLSPSQLEVFIREIDCLLHREHAQDYCGIVYADDFECPTFVKIFDPHHLGSVCGSSASPPLPAWVLSTLPPVDLPAACPPVGARRRWWQRLFAGSSA
jgi:hypothetical protein